MKYLGFVKYSVFIESNENLLIDSDVINGANIYYQYTTSPRPKIVYLYIEQVNGSLSAEPGEMHTFELNLFVESIDDLHAAACEYANCLLEYQTESIKIFRHQENLK